MSKPLVRISAAMGVPTSSTYHDDPSTEKLISSNADDHSLETKKGQRRIAQVICHLGCLFIMLVIIAVLLLMNVVLLAIHYQYQRRSMGTFEEGFATDLGEYAKHRSMPGTYTLICFKI